MRHLTYILPIAWLFTIPVYAQQPPEAPRPPQRQPPAPKNLKLLKPEEIRTTMQAFRVALGVPCTGCHVQGDFASDANRHKEIARKMIVMTRDINAQFGDAKTHVTCYTCHRGAEDPLTAPPASAGAAATPGAPRSAGAAATPAGTTITGCLAKSDPPGTYTLTDEKTGAITRVTGGPDLEAHSANHRVTLTGAPTEQGTFSVSNVQHLAATCQAPAK